MNVNSSKCRLTAFIAVMITGSFLAPNALPVDDPPVPGAIFSTDSTCTEVNVNIFPAKEDVYIDGGPAHPGAAGLPDGSYCVQVTDPSGTTVLGRSDPGAVTVVDGEFVQCYQLTSILKTGSSGFTVPGFDDTPNPGGEYKVWVSTDCDFINNSTKTDNFQVRGDCIKGHVCVTKFYDANANGIQDNGEVEIGGWQFRVFSHDNLHLWKQTPKCAYVRVGTHTVLERSPNELNWIHTTPTEVEFDVETDYTEQVTFGNVCMGAGGGLTLGYWSNTNGQRLLTGSDFVALTAMNFVTGQGTAQDFTAGLSANKTSLRNFLLGANATNMANMLSAQLAAMKLNVLHGFVNGSALIYAPALSPCGTAGLSSLGFISINDVMTAANQSLFDHPYTPAGSPVRACQEALKNALDDANNNKNFTQSSPCPFTFSD
jgi:hypothetical protein